MLTTIKQGSNGNMVKVAQYLTGFAARKKALGNFNANFVSARLRMAAQAWPDRRWRHRAEDMGKDRRESADLLHRQKSQERGNLCRTAPDWKAVGGWYLRQSDQEGRRRLSERQGAYGGWHRRNRYLGGADRRCGGN